MSIIPQKATIATVKIGMLEFEGLMLEDGSFAIAIPQIAALNLVPPNRSVKQLEALLGIAFPSHQKATTPLNSKAVNIVNLMDFHRILRVQDKANNIVATNICDDLIGLSLAQLWADAFNIKFEKEERQRHLLALQTHREQFRVKFTDWLKEDGEKFSLTVNYGAEVNKLKTSANLPLTHLHDYKPEDYPIMEELNRTYHSYSMLRLAGHTHDETIALITSACTK